MVHCPRPGWLTLAHCPFSIPQEQRELTTKLEGSYGDQDVFVPLADKCFKAQASSG